MVLLTLIGMAHGLAAAIVAPDDAVRAATRWAAGNPLLGAATVVTAAVPFSSPSATVYLVTFSPRGAAVFAADTLYAPCRWFSTDGAEAEAAARAIAAAPDAPDAAHESEWAALLPPAPAFSAMSIPSDGAVVPGTVVGPIIPYKWSQERHYNRMCPLRSTSSYNHKNDDRMYSGCVANALAMYLAYYRWPFRGVGSTADTIEPGWQGGETDTACRTDFGADFDFDALLPRYFITASRREAMAVARIQADCGAVLEMNYGDNSSSSSFENYAGVLAKHFLYDAWPVTVTPFGDTTHLELVKPALARGEPILCSGQAGVDSQGEAIGHAYLCDGYCEVAAGGATNTYYHFNFGWNGNGNDWCTLNNVLTHAVGGNTNASYRVANMLVGATPLGTPLFHRTPSAISAAPTLAWEVANWWTNRLTGFTLQRQTLEPKAVNMTLDGSAWYIRMNGYGWSFIDSKPTASTYESFSDITYPTAIQPFLTNGIAVSADTTVTIQYSMRKFDSDVKFYVTVCDGEGSVNSFDSDNTPLPKLATLTGGTSTADWTTGTITLSGASALKSYVGQTGVHLCLYFTAPSDWGWSSSLYGSATPVLRIDSMTVTGTADDWVTKESASLGKDVRSRAYSGLDAEKQRFVLTAHYPGGTNLATTLTTAVGTPPTLACTETANALVYTVSGAADYTYGFRYQNNSIKGTASKSGQTITYTFPKPIVSNGTHWVECFVTNTATGLAATDYHVINLPPDSPLRPYTVFSLTDAVARATSEGKNIFMASVADQNNSRFYGLEDALTSTVVIASISTNFVYWENFAGDAAGAALCEGYWRQQPKPYWYSDAISNATPSIYGYLYLISPTNPIVQLNGDELPSSYQSSTRWNYKNAQYDILTTTDITVTNFQKFLTQSFAYPVRRLLEVLDAGSGAALTNAAIAEAVLTAVTNAAAGDLDGVTAVAIADGDATALYLLGLKPAVAVAGTRATATVSYEFAITSISVDAAGKVTLAAAVKDNLAPGVTPKVIGRAAVLGKAALDAGDWQILASGLLFSNGTFTQTDLAASTNRFFRFSVR